MIKALHIKDFILIDQVQIEFDPGLNIITGETGSGKSILINALNQLCGERSSLEMVRQGAKKAVIEATVHAPVFKEKLLGLLEWGPGFAPEDDNWTLRKEITATGATRIFINDTPVSLNQLREISNLFFELHGQHQHQRLLHPQNHIFYLDEFAGIGTALREFRRIYQKRLSAYEEMFRLQQAQAEFLEKQDVLSFQLDELRRANLEANELEAIAAELNQQNNVEKFHELGSQISALLNSEDQPVLRQLVRAETVLENLTRLNGQYQAHLEQFRQARQVISEISGNVEQETARLEFDPTRVEKLRQREAELQFLLKKYQKLNLSGLIDWRDELVRELSQVEQYDTQIAAQKTLINGLEAEIAGRGNFLSRERTRFASRLSDQVTVILEEAGMNKAIFRIDVEQTPSPDGIMVDGQCLKATATGFDQVQFLIRTNPGEPFKPLNKIASGGEISRVMLSLKSILAETDATPVLIFDEVDIGISGKIAQIVGAKLAEVSRSHQVLSVTHLPQVAAFAAAHFLVSKAGDDRHTTVHLHRLDEERHRAQIAALLGGEHISQQALENADHLISEAQKILARS
jgi:DNA repair protein RecN (Recombination protein N)